MIAVGAQSVLKPISSASILLSVYSMFRAIIFAVIVNAKSNLTQVLPRCFQAGESLRSVLRISLPIWCSVVLCCEGNGFHRFEY